MFHNFSVLIIYSNNLTSNRSNRYVGRGRFEKRWMDCVRDDMSKKGVTLEMRADRREWKRRTCCADPTQWDQGRENNMSNKNNFNYIFKT